MLDAMRGGPKVQSLGAHLFFQIPHQVAMRTHLDRRPVGKIAVVHLKTVMVLEDRDNIARAGFFEETRPGLRVVMLGLEHGNEVFVSELGQWTVETYLVLV